MLVSWLAGIHRTKATYIDRDPVLITYDTIKQLPRVRQLLALILRRCMTLLLLLKDIDKEMFSSAAHVCSGEGVNCFCHGDNDNNSDTFRPVFDPIMNYSWQSRHVFMDGIGIGIYLAWRPCTVHGNPAFYYHYYNGFGPADLAPGLTLKKELAILVVCLPVLGITHRSPEAGLLKVSGKIAQLCIWHLIILLIGIYKG